MSLLTHPALRPLILFLLGIITVLGFAPFYVYPVSLLSIAGFCLYLWQNKSLKLAAKDGFFFGFGLYAFGIYWIYISLHDFGQMPVWMAGLATSLLCAFMAGFSAVMSACAYWLWQPKQSTQAPNPLFQALSIAVFWGIFDWVKSWIFTGFPWLTIGYTQAPNGPLSGLFPIIGAYGVSIFTVLLASLLALFIQYGVRRQPRSPAFMQWIVGGLILFSATGWGTKAIDWTSPVGDAFSVSLIQGNIPQDLKWSAASARDTIQRYQAMVQQSHSDLVLLPETALPILSSQLTDDILQPFIKHTKAHNNNLILGIVEYNPSNNTYFNSAHSYGTDPTQTYQKSHLVPFGEFIPFKPLLGWIYRDFLNMPMSDMSRGTQHPTPMRLGEQTVGVNICYEDVFGEEIIRQLPASTILVNITNDAWYGNSFAADQHLQFSQARALETGRMVLRATNTGATAIIDPKGQTLAHAPHFVQTTLEGNAQGYTGATPYVKLGNWLFLLIALTIIAFVMHRKNQ